MRITLGIFLASDAGQMQFFAQSRDSGFEGPSVRYELVANRTLHLIARNRFYFLISLEEDKRFQELIDWLDLLVRAYNEEGMVLGEENTKLRGLIGRVARFLKENGKLPGDSGVDVSLLR